jgi:Raf kinase inhibitor-like YbhB/YbcL family protein
MKLWSDAIDERGYFDSRYTCDLDNSSPELRWDEIPDGTAGFVVFMEDQDGQNGIFSHWVVYNIPASLKHLPAGIPPQDTLPNGIRQGLNGFGKLGYAGPCPPPTHGAHRYAVRIYSLRAIPELPSRATREVILEAIAPLIISTAEVQARYQRMMERAG